MPAESHSVSTAADLASQVRARRVDPVAITSATLARIAGDSRAVAAFRHVRHDEALAEAAVLAERSDLGELALAGVPVAVKEDVAVAGECPAWESPSATKPFAVDSGIVERLRLAGAVVIGTTRAPQCCLYPMTDDAGPWDLAGFPAMSVPAARYPSGLPIGVQLVAPPGGESQLLALAAQLESLNPWPRIAPQPPSGERDEPDR